MDEENAKELKVSRAHLPPADSDPKTSGAVEDDTFRRMGLPKRAEAVAPPAPTGSSARGRARTDRCFKCEFVSEDELQIGFKQVASA